MQHTIKYLLAKIRAVEKISKIRYDNVLNATKIAKETNDKRLDSMNEFRQSLKDAQATFITRGEHNILHQRIDEDIRVLRESKANIEGKASVTSVYIGYALAVIALMLAIIEIFIKI
jgi:hypothetical protein